MLSFLHVPTMFAMVLWATVIMALTLGTLARRKHVELWPWAWALALQALGYLSLMGRESLPPVWGVVITNAAISASIVMYVWGMKRFNGQPVRHVTLWWPVGLVVGVCLLWADDTQHRLQVVSLLYAVQALLVLRQLRRSRWVDASHGPWLLGAAVLLFLLTMVWRTLALTWGGFSVEAYTQSNVVQSLTYLVSLASTLTLSLGILMMTQEKAERRLAESERRHRLLVEAASEGICIVQDETIRYANPFMHRLFGYPPDGLLGVALTQLVSPQDWPQVSQHHARRLQGLADHFRYPARMMTLHQGERWFEIRGVRMDWQDRPATLNFLNDITDRHLEEEAIAGLAFHDALTQLPNRRLLVDRIDQVRRLTQRQVRWAALMFLDLDRFKPLNDTHGHHVGDLLLVEVGRRLVDSVRSVDTVARLGGDEFVVLLSDLGTEAAQAGQSAAHVAHKVLDVLAQPYELQVPAPQGNDPALACITHRCSASAGVVLFHGESLSAEHLLERADAAMYAAKKAGRHQVCFDPSCNPAR